MKKVIALVTFITLCAAGVFIYPYVLKGAFSLSGKINVSPRLAQAAASRPNTQCFVIVKNMGDVPVAVKQIVNPKFPLEFRIDQKDLILADAWKGPFKMEVQVNSHGQVGELKSGDMFGKLDVPVNFRAKNIEVTIDKSMGVPSLIAQGYEDKSLRIFKYAAR
jgi:hypothetical protein